MPAHVWTFQSPHPRLPLAMTRDFFASTHLKHINQTSFNWNDSACNPSVTTTSRCHIFTLISPPPNLVFLLLADATKPFRPSTIVQQHPAMYCFCRSSKTISVRIVFLDETDFLHEIQVSPTLFFFLSLIVTIIQLPHTTTPIVCLLNSLSHSVAAAWILMM